ncbi:MAG: hypothetical protein ACJASQ_002345 [Crocinitomicaceae bacterium]|jgi:hypothetical protein
MSTTFEVIPVETIHITFREVIELSEKRINAFLESIGIISTIQLSINLHENREKYVNEIDLDSFFNWADNEYVWFVIKGIPGGTDAYCEELKDDFSDSGPWWRLEDILLNNKAIENFELKIEKAKRLNRYWTFRRSAGQPGSINLAYGLISASIAELTGGFIWTEDGAWNFKKFPAEPADFYKWYFRPENEEHQDSKEWALRCLDGIEQEIEAANNK